MSTIHYYIEAYDIHGQEVLGNIDGQAVIRTPNYKRTNAYKRIVQLPRQKLSLRGMVVEYRIVNVDGKIIETIKKD